MGSLDRSKKRVQLWKKAAFHFLLCFIMGFFTGFAPTGGQSSIFSSHLALNQLVENHEFSPEPIKTLHQAIEVVTLNRSLIMAETPVAVPSSSTSTNDSERISLQDQENEAEVVPRKLVIIITPTRLNDPFKEVYLRRMGNTLKLVPPLLWIVVEAQSDSLEVSEMLRRTGVMYRHLVFKENFTDPEAEMDHQRNLALNHIEYHRLNGIVHFAGLSNIFDLEFFEEIRDIEVFGTLPIALLSANRKRVIFEGPVCDSSRVIGWHLRTMNSQTHLMKAPIHISSFAFNSSILWDPERWGRASSVQDTSQNSIKFVQEVVLEDETKLKGIPRIDCSKIMLWHLHIPIRMIPKSI